MSEFTPGPWTFDGPPDNIHVVSAAQPHMRICFLTSNGPTEANARLIAAAPDMRKENIQLREEIEQLKAALRDVLDDIADYERVNNLAANPGRKYCWDSVARARAALEEGP